jgi:hypothetical protein
MGRTETTKFVLPYSLNPNMLTIIQLPSAEHTELEYVLQEFSFAFVLILAKPYCTAKTSLRKCEQNIPRNETARPHSQFIHSYIPRIGLPIWLQQNRWTDPEII